MRRLDVAAPLSRGSARTSISFEEKHIRKRSENLTRWLRKAASGDREAGELVLPVVMEKLKAQARKCLRRERANHTFGPTDLVHEAFVRLVLEKTVNFADRDHFFAISARLMRQILINYARARGAAKRGGKARRIDLARVSREAAPESILDGLELMDLDDALKRLEARPDHRCVVMARTLEMRIFSGMASEDIAAVLGVSKRTANRYLEAGAEILIADLSGGGDEQR